ncbi:hypothetical protein TDB9533_01117 [Thalassocella blandensis]|nr:hypothetical protein TDB9533_01117 [Thalassocella blandensis]
MKVRKTLPRNTLLFIGVGLLVCTILAFYWANSAMRDVEISAASVFESLVKRECDHYLPGEVEVECFYYYTHGSNALPNDSRRGFRLPVVVLKPPKPAAMKGIANLVVHIPGGPGGGFQTLQEEVENWQFWLAETKAAFDLMLFDPRGTGESLPSPKCAEYDRLSDALMAKNMTVVEEAAALNPVLEKCMQAFTHQLSRYLPLAPEKAIYSLSSREQAKDIHQITQRLGYNNVALWGVSYGTRVALLAAQYAEVKLLLLDSPYPLAEGKHSDWPTLYEYDFELHKKLYRPYATAAYPKYETLFSAMSDSLQEKPLPLRVENWNNGKVLPFVLTADRLIDINLDVLYDISQVPVYYRGLQAYLDTGVVGQEFQEVLNGFVSNVLDEQFNYFIYFAVECLDNPLGTLDEYNLALAQASFTRKYFDGLWSSNICLSPIFADHQPVNADIYTMKPSIIYSGEYDPVTPLGWGEDLYLALLNTLHENDESQVVEQNSAVSAVKGAGAGVSSIGGAGVANSDTDDFHPRYANKKSANRISVEANALRWIVVPKAGHAVVDMIDCGRELPGLLAGDLSLVPSLAKPCATAALEE